MALKRSSVRFRLAPPNPNDILQFLSIERKAGGQAHRLQGPDLRLLRHADRLGNGHGRGARASDEQSVAEAHARRNSRSARAPRILAASPDAGETLSRFARDRLS